MENRNKMRRGHLFLKGQSMERRQKARRVHLTDDVGEYVYLEAQRSHTSRLCLGRVIWKFELRSERYIHIEYTGYMGTCMLLAKLIIFEANESLTFSTFSAPAGCGAVMLLVRCLRTNRLDIGSGLEVTVTDIYDKKEVSIRKRSTRYTNRGSERRLQ